MQDIFGEQLKEQRIYLHKIIEEKRRALEDAPKGRLRCKKNHERQEYYWVTDRENTIGRYLLADQQDLVMTLAQKAYDLKALGFAEEEYKRLCALEKYRSALEEKMASLLRERRSVYNKIKRAKRNNKPVLAGQLETDRDTLSERIEAIRKDIKLCDEVKSRAERIQTKLDDEEKEPEIETTSRSDKHR